MSPDRSFHRSASSIPERPLDSRTVDAEKAEPAIRRAMMEGGNCSVEAEGRRRVLVHEPARDAPLERWPWPFPLFAPHNVRFILYEDTMPTSTLIYEKQRIGEAIKYFMAGLPPKAKIIITRERLTGRR